MTNPVEVFSPAKLNLFLAVTGRRPDGFHDLVSVAAPLAWGDRLRAEPGAAGETAFACADPAVPSDESNLVVRAARAFREATGWRGGVRFSLEKRIPIGAGLGGGSSNATAALLALNALAGRPLDPAALASVAAGVGSDCALFLAGGPVVMRGRGERIEPLAAPAASRIRGRRVLVLKPGFGIGTAWAYGRMAERGEYTAGSEAEARLARWASDPSARAEDLLFNGFEAVAFGKYPSLPLLLDRLRARYGLSPLLSGSGSACFALLPDAGGPSAEDLAAEVREAWGQSAFVTETNLA
jgi:4-diphosphocytidyl-2-C-methyl-D-erythritol kinase